MRGKSLKFKIYSQMNNNYLVASKMNATANDNFDSLKRSTLAIHTPIEGELKPLQQTDLNCGGGGGTQQKKEKVSFISAELAFSQEQKRLFDKIGFNKVNTKNQLGQARQRDNLIIQSISAGNNSQLNKSKRRNIGATTQMTQKAKNSIQYQAENYIDLSNDINLSQPQIIQGLSSLALDEELKFIRRQGKADDTFYENRASTLSKTRTQRQLLLDEAMSQKRTSSGSANVMKRLMIMRKIKENNEFDDKVSTVQPENTFETLNDEQEDFNEYQNYTKRTQNRMLSPSQRSNSNLRNGMDRSKVMTELTDKRRDCSSSSYINQGSTLNRIGQFNQNYVSRKTNTEFQQSFTAPDMNNEQTTAFANRTFTYVNILPEGHKQASSSDNRQKNQMIINNQELYEEQENFFNPSDQNIYNELDTKSVISSASMMNRLQFLNSAGAARKLQSNRVISNINALQFVPHVKGVTKQQMIDLFSAKCQDLKIVSSKDQMVRFFDTFVRNQGLKDRRLNLSDLGIGENSIKIVCQIMKNNTQFAQLDLHKNSITNDGIKLLGKTLMKNNTLVHLDVGCNQFSQEGACFLFGCLFNHQSLTSLSLGNSDCYKNKNKIGVKGAIVLGELIARNHLIQFIDLSDSNLSAESLSHVIHGVKQNPCLVSINLSQNDLGQGTSPYTPFNGLMGFFEQNQRQSDFVRCQAIEELVLSNTNLNNKQMEEFGQLLKKCSKTKLQRLDLSHNTKITTKGVLSLIMSLRANLQIKLTHLNVDKTNLSMGMQQEQINNFFELLRVLAEYLRVGKSLRHLSLNGCQVSNDLMNGIGKGLVMNENLEYLSLRSNQISINGLKDVIPSLTDNANLKLTYLDLSSNKIDDQAGQELANALVNVNSLEQLYLRDNELGVEAGDALYFLVQQKKNLWRVQLEKNAIRYGTLVDIERECKRNRRNFYQGRQGHYQGIKQEISELSAGIFPFREFTNLNAKISTQDQIIKQGQDYIHRQEEKVHQLLSLDQEISLDLLTQLAELIAQTESLEVEETELEAWHNSREKELQRKIDFEKSLVDRQRDYMEQELGRKVNEERKKVAEKRSHRRVNEDVVKLKKELEKAERESQLMAMIADNYTKEITRRNAAAAITLAAKNDENQARNGVQSANMVLFFNKKMHQMVTEEKSVDKDVPIEAEKSKKSINGDKNHKIMNPKKNGRKHRSGDRLKNGSKKIGIDSKVKLIANLKDKQTQEATNIIM